MKKGILLVLSGPAGSGKGTVVSRLLATGEYVFSVSATTRAPRPGEVDHVNYHFISQEEFRGRIGRSEMLEYTEYCGNFYGTPKKEAEEVLASGKNLILEIEVEGALNVKAKYPDAVLVMLLPPSFAVQEKRLRGRGTETEDRILARLARTKEEMKLFSRYDYVVVNREGEQEAAAEAVANIVRAESFATKRNPDVPTAYFAE